MKKITELSPSKARSFLLRGESYAKFRLPDYYSFGPLIHKLDKALKGRRLNDFRLSSPRDLDDVNHKLVSNKDGKYAWRPFQLIHPAIYVSLVHRITEKENWKVIVKRFHEFAINSKIECHSLPVMSDVKESSDKESQILNWWEMVEQKSIALALDYRYMLQTDITDCYGSIYTHSVTWAIHTKEEAKKPGNRKETFGVGVVIDNHLQDMSYGQTNGIPQGSALMDFIAEMVLGYVDVLLSERLKNEGIEAYKILRYRDDYRIFSNNPFEAELIAKALSEILSQMGLKLNADKTHASDDVIKSSIKPDKRYWISNKRFVGNKQKWLIQLYLLSEQFPNSGTLETQMSEFLTVLQKSEKKDPQIQTLISLVVEIGFRNPRVIHISVGILTLLINQIDDGKEKKITIQRIRKKFLQVPNSSLHQIWLQRLYLKLDDSITYAEPLCRKVLDKDIPIWNTEWLAASLQAIFNNTQIVNYKEVSELSEIVSETEVKAMTKQANYES